MSTQTVAEILNENVILKKFAKWVIRNGWQGDVDGSAIQDEGVELGLLKLDTVKKGDLDGEYCQEYYSDEDIGETSIYRFTKILEKD